MGKFSPVSDKPLILGGTKEAAELAKLLHSQGVDVTTSLAGRTNEPEPVAGKMRIGGFGGAEKMAEWLMQNQITRVIDATHPFAEKISQNAIEAARIANIPLEIKRRAPWEKRDGDDWITVDGLESAANALPQNARAFLALGSQYLSAFYQREDVEFFIRMVDQPQTPLPFKTYEIILGRPPTDWQVEAGLLKKHNITHIVCRNSGGEGAYAKIKAARNLGIPVIMIENPNNL